MIDLHSFRNIHSHQLVSNAVSKKPHSLFLDGDTNHNCVRRSIILEMLMSSLLSSALGIEDFAPALCFKVFTIRVLPEQFACFRIVVQSL